MEAMALDLQGVTKQYGDFTIERFLYYPFAGDSAAGGQPSCLRSNPDSVGLCFWRFLAGDEKNTGEKGSVKDESVYLG